MGSKKDGSDDSMTIGLGGGCHWCTEAIFESLRGVDEVSQGWIKSVSPNDTFSEAIRLTFQPRILPLDVLIEIHLLTHSSSSDHPMRDKYRSAVYVAHTTDIPLVQQILHALQERFDQPLVTRVLLMDSFCLNDQKYLHYYYNDPDRPFCKTYIDPKLRVLRQKFGKYVNRH